MATINNYTFILFPIEINFDGKAQEFIKNGRDREPLGPIVWFSPQTILNCHKILITDLTIIVTPGQREVNFVEKNLNNLLEGRELKRIAFIWVDNDENGYVPTQANKPVKFWQNLKSIRFTSETIEVMNYPGTDSPLDIPLSKCTKIISVLNTRANRLNVRALDEESQLENMMVHTSTISSIHFFGNGLGTDQIISRVKLRLISVEFDGKSRILIPEDLQNPKKKSEDSDGSSQEDISQQTRTSPQKIKKLLKYSLLI